MIGIFDERNGGHTFSIEASPPAGSSEDAQYTYLATRTGAAGLQQAMFLSLGGVYLLSALLFALSFLQLRSELAVVESSRSGTSALSGEAGSGSW